MRRLIVVVLLAGVLLAALPVWATPTAELTALAQYYPQDTVIFAAFRTDDGYVETLDALLARIQAVVPQAEMPARLPDLLDMAAQQFDSDGDFQSVFRSWLGDTAAFGLLSLEPRGGGNPEFMAVMSVMNRDEAESFVDAFMRETDADFSVTTESGFTLYEVENRNVAVAVTEDALFLTETVDTLRSLNTREAKLNQSADFTAAIDRLPEDDYDAAVYINSPAMMAVAAENMPSRTPAAALAQMEAFMGAAASQVWGFTLDGSSLVLDVASGFGDLSALETAGFVIPTSLAPVDLSFAAHIPADAPFMILGSDLATTYDLLLTNLGAAAALQAEMGNEDAEDFEQGMRFAEVFVRGLTGLDLQTEIMGWMTGSFALFVSVNPDADFEAMDTLPVDFGLAVEATDPTAAANVVAGIQMALEQSEAENVTLSQDQVAGVDVVVITAEPEDSPFPVEILIGSNAEALAIGTRNAVTAIFQPVDGGMAADAAFVAAQDYFLSNTSAVFYLNTQPFEMLAQSMGDDAMDGMALRMFTSLISSSSITATLNEDGSLGRFVLSLAV